jgi:O-antigen ligase
VAVTIDANESPRDRSGTWYLSALLVAPILYDLVHTAAPTAGLATLPWSLVVLYGAGIVAIVSWIRFRAATAWDRSTRLWMMLGVVVWLDALVMSSLKGDGVAGAAILVPLTFFLILLKRPARADIWRAADALGWTLVGASALILLLEVAHLIPAWYASHGDYGVFLEQFDRENYWLPLRSLLGLDGRWAGTTGYPSPTGQGAALLMVYGFIRPRGRRVVFVGTGAFMLLLTDSRTSYAAGAVGLCLLAALPGWGTSTRRVTAARALAAILGVAMGIRVLVQVLVDPSLTGRLSMWAQFLSLATGSPLVGSGMTGIEEAIAAGDIPAWAHQGHNIFLDTFVRYGVVGLILAVAFLAIALLLTLGGPRRGVGVGLAMLVALVVSCMGDLGLDWVYPSAGLSALLVAVLVSRPE